MDNKLQETTYEHHLCKHRNYTVGLMRTQAGVWHIVTHLWVEISVEQQKWLNFIYRPKKCLLFEYFLKNYQHSQYDGMVDVVPQSWLNRLNFGFYWLICMADSRITVTSLHLHQSHKSKVARWEKRAVKFTTIYDSLTGLEMAIWCERLCVGVQGGGLTEGS